MQLSELITNEVEEREGVFFLKGHSSFNYSDGDETEDYIYSVISNARDISSTSQELEQHIRDWPSLYHFSRERSAAYQSLALPRTASVLEVGCGCGAITRYLGENVARVVALEGSPRRARIARTRTRDLDNVSVLCASFEDVKFNGVFDYIVCNGVLEYAPLFVRHEHPAREFIRLLVSLLKPHGDLIVAIENKLGLRYFSSGKEEHTDTMYDGLEGYPRYPGGPSTFGYAELYDLLKENCPFVRCLLPLPDYKLPTAVVCAELLEEVNCADLFSAVTRHDFGTYEEPRMHERLVWHELQKNGLMRDFANSFLMIAGQKPSSLIEPDWLGDIYAIKRNKDAMVKTTISRLGDGTVQTEKKSLGADRVADRTGGLGHALDCTRWVDGVSIHTMAARAMLRQGDAISLADRLREPVAAWWEGILTLASTDGGLRGEALDCIWQNAIISCDQLHFIDKEWVSEAQIDPTAVIFRAVTNFAAQERYYYRRWDASCRDISEASLLQAVANIVQVEITFSSLLSAMTSYLEVLEDVYGERTVGLKRYYRLACMYLNLHMPFSWLKTKEKISGKTKSIVRRLARPFRRLRASVC